MSKRAQAELMLVVITFVWGATFVVVKAALAEASPMAFVALRFLLAGILLFAVLARRARAPWGRAVAAGAVLALFLFAGFYFQTWGLVYTTAAKSAFITGFSVILVPILAAFEGSRLGAFNIAGALAGLAGIYILAAPSGAEGVNRGDVLTVLAAVSFAVHIVLVGRYTKRIAFEQLVPVQVLGVGVLAVAAVPLDPGFKLHWTPGLAAAILVTSVFATALAFTVQNWAQQYTPAPHTALIFALEPVFAGLTSHFAAGERLGGRALAGSALILAGMLLSELRSGKPAAIEG